jgi:Glycosyl hydrolase family 47
VSSASTIHFSGLKLSTSPRFNGWGVTMYDSLDTMYLMGLEDEFQRALHVIEKAIFPVEKEAFAPFFETVIRYLGGLLSAYALSKEHILLIKAEELARVLSPVFQTPSGLPIFQVNTVR